MLRREDIHDVSDALPQPFEPNSDESQDEDQQIEFDSDGSTDSDGVEEQTRLNSHDEPQLASEALFLVGCRSRFGRTIRFNQ